MESDELNLRDASRSATEMVSSKHFKYFLICFLLLFFVFESVRIIACLVIIFGVPIFSFLGAINVFFRLLRYIKRPDKKKTIILREALLIFVFLFVGIITANSAIQFTMEFE